MSELNPLLKQIDNELHRYLAFDNTKKVHEHLLKHATEIALSEVISDVSVTDLDILNLIATHSEIRIKELVETVYFPQGTVSKIVNRLVKKRLVKKYHHTDNKKDVYLKLTESGQTLAILHVQYHKTENQKLNKIGARFSNKELARFAEMLKEINELREK